MKMTLHKVINSMFQAFPELNGITRNGPGNARCIGKDWTTDEHK